MYCPSCGTEAADQTKYCVKCGINLRRVKGVLGKGGASLSDGSDWGTAWSESHRSRIQERRKRLEEWRKKTPEEKRFNEIKAGVIVSSVGFGLMVFLNLLFDAIASTTDEPSANILRSLWAVGLVPFMVGLGVLFNGLFVSRRIVELKRHQQQADQQEHFFSAPDTSPVARHLRNQMANQIESAQPPIPDFSVTETTTTKLREPVSAPSPRDTGRDATP